MDFGASFVGRGTFTFFVTKPLRRHCVPSDVFRRGHMFSFSYLPSNKQFQNYTKFLASCQGSQHFLAHTTQFGRGKPSPRSSPQAVFRYPFCGINLFKNVGLRYTPPGNARPPRNSHQSRILRQTLKSEVFLACLYTFKCNQLSIKNLPGRIRKS